MNRNPPSGRPIPQAYHTHPLLDPRLPSNNPACVRQWISTYRRLRRSPEAYQGMLRSYAFPLGVPERSMDNLGDYFRDADSYLDDLLRLVPKELADEMRPLPEIRRCNDILDLLQAALEGTDARTRYEAQRKLYLAKLLFDVDHCRSVRDGPRHRARFEAILSEKLWCDLVGREEIEVCCRLQKGGDEDGKFEIGVSPEPGSVCWRFQVRSLPATDGEPKIEIYHYRSRFKKEANPDPGSRAANGLLTLAERPRWPGLGRRSGSIVSKMIRRGIADPRMVNDLLGAMFIVGSRRQAYALEKRLISIFGGPLRWRDRVDTLSGEKDRARLDPRSSSGFQVLKEIVDILTEDPDDPRPYLFAVEVQIFTLEAYLRTLHADHFASHYAYKRRTFLHDLLPALFPPEVYGEETPHRAAEA